jgi:hypothetical protein
VAEEQQGQHVCERCGRVRAAACDCGGSGQGRRAVPEGWDPEVTRPERPRLGLVARPERPE